MDSNNLRKFRRHFAWFGVVGLSVLTACTDLAPQFEIEGTGSLAGLVFFDASEDGIFDLSDGDSAIAGVGIAIQDRGTGETFAGGTAQSDASGRFTVTDLPGGTHDLLVDTLTVPAGVSICQNPLPVSIILQQTSSVDVVGRPGCLITIAEAKEEGSGGAFVIVRGVLTSDPGQVEARRTYIQDATAGTLIFDGAFATTLAGLGLVIGDQIEIGGSTAEFSTEFELVGVSLRESVVDVGVIEPDTVTTAEIAGITGFGKGSIQGRLLRIEKAQLTVAFGDGTGSSSNARFDDGSGATLVRVERGVVASSGDLNTLYTVGTCYDINGFGASFAGAGQIFPRSQADIVVVPCT